MYEHVANPMCIFDALTWKSDFDYFQFRLTNEQWEYVVLKKTFAQLGKSYPGSANNTQSLGCSRTKKLFTGIITSAVLHATVSFNVLPFEKCTLVKLFDQTQFAIEIKIMY
jgi:hypothetical protein